MKAKEKHKPPAAVFIGVHVGTNRERSGIAVARAEWRTVEDRRQTHFLVPYLEARPAGERYPDLARRVVEVYEGIRQRDLAVWNLYVSATVHGGSVADLIEEQLSSERVTRVYFNHGDRRSEKADGVNLGKARLVDRLKMQLQVHRLHLAKSEETSTLAAELCEYEIKVDEKANERYGAFRVGTRDELVTALGLATQVDHPGGDTIFDIARTWGTVDEVLNPK